MLPFVFHKKQKLLGKQRESVSKLTKHKEFKKAHKPGQLHIQKEISKHQEPSWQRQDKGKEDESEGARHLRFRHPGSESGNPDQM